MKGIILAGGSGTRLHPITRVVSKQLLPVYDKPMIYYPLSILMLAGLREILVISTPQDLPRFQDLLGDGSQWGLSFAYAEQPHPGGLAQAFIIGRDFVGRDRVCLILGDNIFEANLKTYARNFTAQKAGARLLLKKVDNPKRFGVAEISDTKVTGIEEKPKEPKSDYAVTGVYFYDNTVFEIIRTLKPSARNELEIADVNNAYIAKNQLSYDILEGWWTDAGTFESLNRANEFVRKEPPK